MALREASEPRSANSESPADIIVGRGIGIALLTEIQERRLAKWHGLGELMPQTLAEIAAEEGVTHQAVDQSVDQALKRLDFDDRGTDMYAIEIDEVSRPAGISDYDWNLHQRVKKMPFHRIELLELIHRGFERSRIVRELEGIGSIDRQLELTAKNLGMTPHELDSRIPEILYIAGEIV